MGNACETYCSYDESGQLIFSSEDGKIPENINILKPEYLNKPA